jgi:hypothetical protein
MITVSDVLSALKLYSDTKGYSEEMLSSCAATGLNYIKERLKDGAEENSPLVLEAAVSVAHYHFFLGAISSSDRYESYKAGDMTIRRNISKELQFEKEVLVCALSKAASILTDTEFCVIAC